MAVITILLLVPIYIINLIIGVNLVDPVTGETVSEIANYWYLMDTPGGESLMDLMPAAPSIC